MTNFTVWRRTVTQYGIVPLRQENDSCSKYQFCHWCKAYKTWRNSWQSIKLVWALSLEWGTVKKNISTNSWCRFSNDSKAYGSCKTRNTCYSIACIYPCHQISIFKLKDIKTIYIPSTSDSNSCLIYILFSFVYVDVKYTKRSCKPSNN